MAGGSALAFDSASPVQIEYSTPHGVFDEVFESPGHPRAHWAAYLRASKRGLAAEFQRRNELAHRQLAENGVNFNAFTNATQIQRPWLLDLLPLIIDADEWRRLAGGLTQRARLLQAIVRDLHGPRRLIHDRVLPAEALFAHPGFFRAFDGLHGDAASLVFFGAELARGADGAWRVMADRTSAPVGPGFALENRVIAGRCMPTWMQRFPIQRLAPFFLRLQNTLAKASDRTADRPRIVILASGPDHPYHFEDAYLARYLGYTLVEGGDLAVRDERVFLKTLAGLVPVDAIFFRGSEAGIDPLELGGHSSSGVPGLLQAIRKRNVSVVNTPGCGMLESPLFMAYLPRLCQAILGEELLLPSIDTWWCGDAGSRAFVYQHWNNLVIKPAFAPSGSDEIFPSRLSAEEQEALRQRIERHPFHFVAQSLISRSAAPVWDERGVSVGHIAVRTFLVYESNDYHVMPGGLVRVAKTAEPMELSISAGDSSKDLWVLAEKPVEKVTLLSPPGKPAELRRTSALFPSRVADNLFWLGQAFDRAEFLVRAVRTLCDRLSSENELDQPAIPALVRILADQGQLEPGLTLEEMQAQMPQLDRSITTTIFDSSEPNSLASSLGEMIRLASLVRDWISPETWQVLTQAPGRFLARSHHGPDIVEAATHLNTLSMELAAASGLMNDGMIRGPAWRFLDMGRRIERGRNICRLVLACEFSKVLAESSVLKALLQIIDCRMTYRTRYLDNFQRNAVLDLCATDETNPHSVIFQASVLAEHVDSLPHDPSLPLRTEEKRLAMASVHALRMITPEQLADAKGVELYAVLRNVESKLRELGDLLTRKYLVHSGEPRQLSDLGTTR